MLIQYSVSFDPAHDPADLLEELRLSLWSLRRHNTRLPVVVFGYDPMPAALRRLCDDHGAELIGRGGYAERLASLCVEGAGVLAGHPTLHKFLNFDALAWLDGADRVLLCDCDTLFRSDVEQLFATYTEADLYAREEVHTGPSHYGPNPAFLDEPALRRLAAALGVAFVPPVNTGVVLVNHGRAAELRQLDHWFVQCAWHFMVWMSLNPLHTSGSGFPPLTGVDVAHRLASTEQLARALTYPSANQWIVEEVATWLALGALPGLVTGRFSPRHVPQNGELASGVAALDDWLVCHYFSTDPSTALTWLELGGATTAKEQR